MASPSPSANLLAAFMARIEEVIYRLDPGESPRIEEVGRGFERRGLLEPRPDY
jgi:hypothetical protein